MKATDIIEPIRHKIGQTEYFDLLSAIERRQSVAEEAVKRAEANLSKVLCDMDALRERFKYNVREREAAENFLADMTKQRDSLQSELNQMKAEVKRLTEELEDKTHEEALARKYGKRYADGEDGAAPKDQS